MTVVLATPLPKSISSTAPEPHHFSPSNLCTTNDPPAGSSDCINMSLLWDTLEQLAKVQQSFDDDDFEGGATVRFLCLIAIKS